MAHYEVIIIIIIIKSHFVIWLLDDTSIEQANGLHSGRERELRQNVVQNDKISPGNLAPEGEAVKKQVS